MAKRAIFSNSGVYSSSKLANSGSTRAVLQVTLRGKKSYIPITVIEAQGDISLQYSSDQDFVGNSYFTVFGKSVGQLSLTCMEVSACGNKKGSSSLVKIANEFKSVVNSRQLPRVQLNYLNSSMRIAGVLTDIEFTFNSPYQTFKLTVVGSQV